MASTLSFYSEDNAIKNPQTQASSSKSAQPAMP
jgi:hypothetical protein